MNGTYLSFKKGASIFQEGDAAENLFLIKDGTVQISKQTDTGKELTIRLCSSNSLIGENIAFCKLNRHATTAIVMEDVTLYSLNNELLEMHLTEQPTLMTDYLQWIQVENIKNQSRLRDLMLHGKKGALFSTLIRLANTYGQSVDGNSIYIDFLLTNSEMANLCATSREMINRMLSDLKKQRIISIEKGYITIHQLDFLKQEISCDECPLCVCRID